jgi:surface antigen
MRRRDAASEEEAMIGVKPFLAVAGAVAGAATWTGAAQAQGATPSPVAAWEVNIYLQDSERVRAAAALEQASRAPVGTTVAWNDSLTRAAGTIVPTGDSRRADGAACRTYDVVVMVPRRTSQVWSYYTTGPSINPSFHYFQRDEQLSPAFARRFTAQACRTASGALVAG